MDLMRTHSIEKMDIVWGKNSYFKNLLKYAIYLRSCGRDGAPADNEFPQESGDTQ
jgi:hypothetical protein